MFNNNTTADFKTAIEHISGGIEVCKYNQNFSVIYASHGFFKLTGYSNAEILEGHGHSIFMLDEDFENLKEQVKQQLQSEQASELEYRMLKKDGSSIWVLDKFILGKSSDGEICLYHVITDISNQKQHELLLLQRISELEREKQYGTTMTSKQLLTYEANVTKDSIININPGWATEFGITPDTGFSELVNAISTNAVAPEHREMFVQKLSPDYIIAAFEHGERILTIEYLKLVANNQYRWFQKNVNIIQDAISGDISIRCYIADIDYKKSREIKAFEEQRLYETMRSRADVIYEINITKNNFIAGHNSWGKLFGISQTSNYSDMMQQFSENAIHPDDKDGFKEAFKRSNVLEAYEDGKMDIIFEYRQPNKDGEYVWVSCTMHLFTDPDTGEVRGHSYIENINKKKLEQLELIYKSEHDLLTGFYNKIATEKYITDFLSTGEGKIGTHAFLIIDVDYFKSVNDNFGHAFGDAVLSQFSAKIRDLFRDVDILGRIGGDEFVVFMKNVQSKRVVLAKAREICSQVNDSFNKNGTNHKISASIGIAFYNEHGKIYQELYKNSDAALYISKQQGRDQYTVYNDNMCVLVSNIKAIDPHEFIEPKSFEKNIIEYIFRILYESNDKCLAINSVLELVGKHFNCDRTYIFENSPDSLYMSSTFEWCSDGIASQRLHSQSIPPELLKKSKNTFNQNGMFFLPDVAKSFIDPSEVFIPSDVKSLLQFSIDKNNEFRGFIGFDQCKSIRIPTKKEMSDLQSISNILGVFIMEMRAIEETVASKNMALSIINNLYSYAYVCDPANYKILFMNQKILEISPNAKIHDHCYSTIWQRKTPCEFCPIKSMINNRGDDFTMKLFNPLVNSWVKSTASWIDWLDGTKMCLVSISPISNQNK